jgi:hypothetical protein
MIFNFELDDAYFVSSDIYEYCFDAMDQNLRGE